MTTWGVKDHNGEILPDFLGSSRIQVGCKVLPARYDAFRLHVSASYRELFDRTLRRALEENQWQIIRIKRGKPQMPRRSVSREGQGVVCGSYGATTQLANELARAHGRIDAH